MFKKIEREEALYEIVAEELASGQLKQGLWLKALVQANSDDNRARAEYAKLRVSQLDREYKAVQAKAEKAKIVSETLASTQKQEDARSLKEREKDLYSLRSLLKQKRCGANANPKKGFALHLPSGTSKHFGRLDDLHDYLRNY